MDLFEASVTQNETPLKGPLADRLRPKTWSEFMGQGHFAGEDSDLLKAIEKHNFLPNLILWGPPGTGKTSFARILASSVQGRFIERNAISTGAKELRGLGEEAGMRRLQFSEKTILFVDEIHRLNKSQQDVLLPFIEKGDLVLVGATTENPGYSLNAAVLSRSRVLNFKPLEPEAMLALADRAFKAESLEASQVLETSALEGLCQQAAGDARRLLTNLESLIQAFQISGDGFPLGIENLEEHLVTHQLPYDRAGDAHYDTISAFIKSIRGSDPDAGIYYLVRMLEAGEDPVFIARRLVILASEDVGNADPRALQVATSGAQAVELIGLPEAAINLAQVVTYLACAPKSNRSYMALNAAKAEVKKSGALPIPLELRSSKTSFAKSQGYGKGYEYSHDQARGFSEHGFLPEELSGRTFYEISDRGFEKTLRQYQAWVKGNVKSDS